MFFSVPPQKFRYSAWSISRRSQFFIQNQPQPYDGIWHLQLIKCLQLSQWSRMLRVRQLNAVCERPSSDLRVEWVSLQTFKSPMHSLTVPDLCYKVDPAWLLPYFLAMKIAIVCLSKGYTCWSCEAVFSCHQVAEVLCCRSAMWWLSVHKVDGLLR
jgi:hypothetical protein